jgi:hypothetical protein
MNKGFVAQSMGLCDSSSFSRGHYLRGKGNGEGGNRTHDTTIFSRVLYQLSYLAWGRLWAALWEG